MVIRPRMQHPSRSPEELEIRQIRIILEVLMGLSLEIAHPLIVKVAKRAELDHLFRQKLFLSQLQLFQIRKTKPLG